MMIEIRFLVMLVLSVISANCAVISAKALYCRDPDTGKLHPVNATWSSSSFCGNYTCKIRRRFDVNTERTPLRQFNITNMPTQNGDENKIVTIEKKTEADVQPLLHKNKASDPKNMITEDVGKSLLRSYETLKPFEEKKQFKPKSHNCKMEKGNIKTSEKSDRYLTEKEIDNIAELLHTVKKSDLEAVVDIYNLAQDIYKEMYKDSDKELITEAVNLIKNDAKQSRNDIKATSYWYDTLGYKGKVENRNDMDLQSTHHVVHSTVKPKANDVTYFNGALLTSNDFGKIPYYYPVTQFQRISSYTHPVPKTTAGTQLNKTETVRKPTTSSRVNNIESKLNSKNNKIPYSEIQQFIQPSRLLPFPFANIHHYNFTDTSHYYYKNPRPMDYYGGYKYYPYFNAYLTPIPKAILVNPHLSSEVQSVEQKPVRMGKTEEPMDKYIRQNKMVPAWKTEPISIDVLKDIRANIDPSRLVRAFPLRKKIKLERAGKLININELSSQLNRSKRSPDKASTTDKKSSDLGDYEAYLEKTTCNEQTVPGYFRIGNMSQPYPSCCPQMIDTR